MDTKKGNRNMSPLPSQLNSHFLLLNSWGFMKKKAVWELQFISKDYKGLAI